MFGNVRDCDMWVEAHRAKYHSNGLHPPGDPFWRRHFDQLLGHCGAVTDAPCSTFAAELLAAYPDAKVIVVSRPAGGLDMERWFDSFSVILRGHFALMLRVLSVLDPTWYGRIHAVGTAWMEDQLKAFNLEQALQNAPGVYERYYEEVRRLVPEERRLEYRLGEGWAPLCKFVGKDIPRGEDGAEVPFPHKNESQSLQKAFEEMGTKVVKRAARNVAGVVFAAAVAWASWLIAT
ncbi:MAG: hypothetical protein Q9160_005407 [Pyrenula sp. 1 TL-2023]